MTNNGLPQQKPSTVLIVEDQAPMRAAIVDLVRLSLPSLTVLEAVDGAGARSMFEAARPACVVMDVNLPDADGIALTRDFKKASESTTVIVISVRAHEGDRALAAGAAAFVPKDCIFDELVPLLRRSTRTGS